MLRNKLTYANVTATLAVALAAGGGFAVAQSGPSGAINACAKKKGGALRIASKCRKDERRIVWSQAGRPGAAGTTGTTGTTGAAGTAGVPGAAGAKGEPGAPNPNAANANLLDNLDSTDFLRGNAQAAGDVAGPFADLQIGAGKVGTNEVDGSLTGLDIADTSSLGSAEIAEYDLKNVNASQTDNKSLVEINFRGTNDMQAQTTLDFGQLELDFACDGGLTNDVSVTVRTQTNSANLVASDHDSNVVDASFNTNEPKDLEAGLTIAEGNQAQLTYRSQFNDVTTAQFVALNSGMFPGDACRVFGTAVTDD